MYRLLRFPRNVSERLINRFFFFIKSDIYSLDKHKMMYKKDLEQLAMFQMKFAFQPCV